MDINIKLSLYKNIVKKTIIIAKGIVDVWILKIPIFNLIGKSIDILKKNQKIKYLKLIKKSKNNFIESLNI